jgi:hypothetical protein
MGFERPGAVSKLSAGRGGPRNASRKNLTTAAGAFLSRGHISNLEEVIKSLIHQRLLL